MYSCCWSIIITFKNVDHLLCSILYIKISLNNVYHFILLYIILEFIFKTQVNFYVYYGEKAQFHLLECSLYIVLILLIIKYIIFYPLNWHNTWIHNIWNTQILSAIIILFLLILFYAYNFPNPNYIIYCNYEGNFAIGNYESSNIFLFQDYIDSSSSLHFIWILISTF